MRTTLLLAAVASDGSWCVHRRARPDCNEAARLGCRLGLRLKRRSGAGNRPAMLREAVNDTSTDISGSASAATPRVIRTRNVTGLSSVDPTTDASRLRHDHRLRPAVRQLHSEPGERSPGNRSRVVSPSQTYTAAEQTRYDWLNASSHDAVQVHHRHRG